MRRPMVLMVAAVLSGTLYGLPEIPVVYSISAVIFLIAATVRLVVRYRGRNRMPLYFLLCICTGLMFISFLRAKADTKKYESFGEFYEKYEATNPGEFDYALYLKAMDVTDEAERKALKERNPELENGFKRIINDFKDSCASVIERRMTENDAGIVKAMFLGDKTGMDADVKSLYQDAGIAHLLAVSGLHVSLIGMSLYRLLKNRLSLGLKPSAACASLATVLYVIFTGAQASSIRAGIMMIAGMIALCIGRKKDLASALSFSAILLLLYRPYLITQSGFLLSFTAIIGIILAKDDQTAAVSGMMVTAATLPVIAGAFYKVPMYSVLLNLLVIPLMTVVVVSGGCVLLFEGIAFVLQALPFLSGIFCFISALSASPAHYVLKLYAYLGNLSLKLPFSKVVTGRPDALKTVIFYLILFVFSNRIVKIKNKILKPVLIYTFLILSVFFLKQNESGKTYVTVLDVGQGDCFHVHDENTDIIIDCGSSGYERAGSRILENYLLSRGISEIDAILVSHADSDHTNGILYLLSEEAEISSDTLILPALAKIDPKYDKLKEAASERSVTYCKKGMVLKTDHLKLKCIYSETDKNAMSDTNRESAVWLLDSEEFRMLFNGDITEKEETEIKREYAGDPVLESIDVLKCSHHGSDTANSEEYLKFTDPEIAVLSYGKNNERTTKMIQA